MSLQQLSANVSEPLQHAFTVVSLSALAGWIVGALPAFSLCVTAVWGIIKCVEGWYSVKLKRLEYRNRK